MAAPSIRGATAPVNGLSTTSPAGTQVGDLVVVITGERAGAGIPTHTIDGAYTAIREHSHNDGSTDGRGTVAYTVATSSGAQSYQAVSSTSGSSANCWTGCIVFSVDTYDVTTIPANSATQTNTAVPNPPSLTNLTGDFVVCAVAFWHLGSALSLSATPPTNYAEQWEIAGSQNVDLSLATRALTGLSAATEDPGTFGDNQTPNGTFSITFAIAGALAEISGALVHTPLALSLVQTGIIVQLYGSGSDPARITKNTTDGTSLMLFRGGKTGDMGGGSVDDSLGNAWTRVGNVEEMSDWSGYGTSAWISIGIDGGASHNLDCFVTDFDEHTVTMVEVQGVDRVEDQSFTQYSNAQGGPTNAASPVTVSGPALIVATWNGTGPVGNGNHVATPDNGFANQEGFGTDDPNGYVQQFMATRLVLEAGTYGVTWTNSPTQGTQLRMIALAGDPGSTLTSAGTVADATIAGTLDITQGANTVTADGDLYAGGALSLSQAAQTVATGGDVAVQASTSATQGAQTIAADGTVAFEGVSATFDVAQGGHTANSNVDVSVVGTASASQAAQTSTSDVDVATQGAASLVAADDSLSSGAGVAIIASASPTQASHTAASAVAVEVLGQLNASSGADTVTGAGGAPSASAVLDLAQGANTGSATATLAIASSATLGASADQMTASAGVVIGVATTASQAADIVAGDGTLQVVALLAVAQAADTLVATTEVPVSLVNATATIAEVSTATAVPTVGSVAAAAIAPSPRVTATITEE